MPVSKYVLSNSVSVAIPGKGPVQMQPGKVIDDGQFPIALLQKAGAVLVLQADVDPTVAARVVERKRKGKSLPLDEAELQEALSGSGPVNLAGGVTSVVGALPLGNLAGVPSPYQQLVWTGSAWVGIGILSATLTDKNSVVDCGLSSAGTDGNASQFILPASTLSANRTLTLNTDSAVAGETITVVRLDATAHTYAIINGGAGGGTLITLPASAKRVCSLTFDGSNWNLASVASLS